MSGLSDFRAQHPEYNDMPDAQLSDALYKKYYSDIPRQQFDAKMGGTAAPSQQTAPQGAPSPVVDAIRSIPTGVSKGLAGIAGLPGDMRNLVNSGADWALQKLGADPAMIADMQKTRGRLETVPTSEAINKAVSDPFGGYYEPKTTAGKYAETISSFAPLALSPGSLAARAARVIVPATASETAGQATKGTPYEAPARALGALVGGGATGFTERALQKSATIKAAPTLEELAKAKKVAYDAAQQNGVVISAPAWQSFAQDVKAKMAMKPFREDLHPNATSALKTVEDEAGDVTLENADAIRQVLNDAIESASKNTNKGDLARATQIKGMLDDFLDNLKPADTLAGDASVAVPILKEARALAAREYKGKTIQKLIDMATNSASSNYSASGVEQALRVQFKNLNAQFIKNPTIAKAFTPAERRAIVRVAQGGPVGNALRMLGKAAPTGGISAYVMPAGAAGVGSIFGGPTGAVIGGLALPAVGAIGRAGATASTLKNAQAAAALARSGGILGPQPNPALPSLLGILMAPSLAQTVSK